MTATIASGSRDRAFICTKVPCNKHALAHTLGERARNSQLSQGPLKRSITMSIQLHTHRLVRIALTFAIGLATFVAPLAGPVAAASPAKADTPDALEIYNRDVFVIVGSTLRLPDDTTAADAPLFNVAGVPLNLTWGDWQQASATSRASVTGGKKNPKTDFRIHLTGLAPNGVYSIFYVTL